MKILISSASYPPKVSGVAVFSQSLAEFAAARGHEVLVLTSRPRTTVPIRGHSGSETGNHTPGVPASPAGGKEGGRIRVVELPSVRNPFHHELTVPVPSRRQLDQFVTEFQPDIIHLQDPLLANAQLAGIAATRGIPVIATHHFSYELLAAYVPAWLRPILKLGLGWWLRRSYRHCVLVTAPSQKTVNDLKQLGVTAPLQVLSNGVALERFGQSVPTEGIRERFDLPAEEPILLFVGRLDPDKSIDILLRAVAIARATRPLHLVLVGDGDARQSLEALAQSLGISAAVTLTGRIEHGDAALVGLYQLAELFVTASTIETQGIVVIEAMAAGLPVIAVNANALPELVTAATGQLVPAGDAAAFAASILELIADPARRHLMGAAAQVAAERHALDRCLGRFLAEYARLTKRP